MKGQLSGLMKQAQAMQDNMKKMQDQLAILEVEGQSGAGLVKVLMTCKYDVKRVTIDKTLLEEDKDMLEDLVAAAINDAVRKAESTSSEKMAGMTAGMALPPGFKLPFWFFMSITSSLDFLINTLRRLPGIGPRFAQRIAYYLLQGDRETASILAKALNDAVNKIQQCIKWNTFSEIPPHH